MPGMGNEHLELSASFCRTDLKTFFDDLNQRTIDPEEAISGAKAVFKFVETSLTNVYSVRCCSGLHNGEPDQPVSGSIH
jgi:uncharacterized protein YgbK (DUF1537 family)